MELAIVLVIIGLIIGGILVGQDMVRGAQLKSLYTETESYKAAVNTFKSKYNTLPGDGVTHQFFSCCDGNNNGRIDQYSETYRFWQQLSQSGMIPGEYTGLAGPNGFEPIIGENVPAKKFNNIGEQIFYMDWGDNFSNGYGSLPGADGMANRFQVGGYSVGAITNTGFLTTREAQAFDAKYDDGNPTIGQITTIPQGGVTACVYVGPNAQSAYYNTANYGGVPLCSIGFKANF